MFGAESITDDIVRAAAGGSSADRERVMEALGLQVRAMVMVRLAPNAAQMTSVDDLSQQALMAVDEGLGRLEAPTVDGLRAFTSGVVQHKVIDFIRSINPGDTPPAKSLDSSFFEKSLAGPLRELIPATGLTPRSAAARAESVREAIVALGALKTEHRDVIALAFFDQLPMEVIANRLEISRPAASMLLMRALKILRRRLTGSSRLQNGGGPSEQDHVH